MNSQRNAAGSLRHLLTLEDLSRSELEMLLERAQYYSRQSGDAAPRSDVLTGVTVANLFTEPSTRTRVSFELAAKRLGADVVNLEVQLSSRVKGESMLDTIFTLEALHVDVFVLRDAEGTVTHRVGVQVDDELHLAAQLRDELPPFHPLQLPQQMAHRTASAPKDSRTATTGRFSVSSRSGSRRTTRAM